MREEFGGWNYVYIGPVSPSQHKALELKMYVQRAFVDDGASERRKREGAKQVMKQGRKEETRRRKQREVKGVSYRI